VTKKRKLSPRGQRRAAERDAVDRARKRVQMAKEQPGGHPGRPIAVASAAVIEARARAVPCAVCQAALDLDAHEATTHDGLSLRRVRLVCKECHTPRELWFHIEPPLPS
jgi:hypothetical protein